MKVGRGQFAKLADFGVIILANWEKRKGNHSNFRERMMTWKEQAWKLGIKEISPDEMARRRLKGLVCSSPSEHVG